MPTDVCRRDGSRVDVARRALTPHLAAHLLKDRAQPRARACPRRCRRCLLPPIHGPLRPPAPGRGRARARRPGPRGTTGRRPCRRGTRCPGQCPAARLGDGRDGSKADARGGRSSTAGGERGTRARRLGVGGPSSGGCRRGGGPGAGRRSSEPGPVGGDEWIGGRPRLIQAGTGQRERGRARCA